MAEAQIERLKSRSDIVEIVSEQVELKRAGQSYTGRCPFHADKSPSFVVSPAKQLFHCFGCGAGGDVIKFVMQLQGLSFPEAAERLSTRAGLPWETREARKGAEGRDKEGRLVSLNLAASDYFHKALLGGNGTQARGYLAARGVTGETIRAFTIGYAPPQWDDLLKGLGASFPSSELLAAGLVVQKEGGHFYDRFRHRILFPIRSRSGEIVGFGGRAIDDATPKYLNSPETALFSKGQHLFGLDRLAPKFDLLGNKALVVVEGYFDAVTAHQAGFTRTVATMGTALTSDHVGLIRRMTDEVVLAFDGDEAGVRAAYRASLTLLDRDVRPRIVALPPGEDPDLLIRKKAEDFSGRMAQAATPADFFISRWADRLAPVQRRAEVAEEIFALIRPLRTRMEQGQLLMRLAEALALPELDLRADFFRHGKKNPRAAAPLPTHLLTDSVPKDEAFILERLLDGQLPPTDLDGRLSPEDFSDPDVRQLIAQFWEGSGWKKTESHPPSIQPESIRGADEESRHETTRATEDVIAAFQAKRLDGEIVRLGNSIKQMESEGKTDDVPPLQRQLGAARKERNRLSPAYFYKIPA
jgi:DNA primase